ncbi:MAG: hypothetical protein HYR76_00370 [Ignavibacteria bacterium]|nr:hypothetical protein [Ignavibacteria bacterium]
MSLFDSPDIRHGDAENAKASGFHPALKRAGSPPAAGMLSAKGFKGGKLISQDKIETTGAPAGIKLIPGRSAINADGEDLSIVTVAVVDSKGRVVPTASNNIKFELNGPGKIIGIGNGDPICHEPDVFFDLPSSSITTLGDWRILSVPTVKDRPEIAEDVNDSLWQKVDTRGGASQLDPDKSAIFRTHVSISEKELEADNIVVQFGMIDDDGWVYVNGQFAGESHDWSADPSINIRKFLHTGNNTIAVAVKNNGGPGGLNNGVTLEVTKKQIATNWQRSAFNGLVQVIVQSGKVAGEIKLNAQADGLHQGSIVIPTAPHPGRSLVE